MSGIVEDQNIVFPEVFQHLQHVESEPASNILDEELLKRGERALDAHTPRQLLWRLLGTGEQLLQKLQQDPRPLTRLLERTVALLPFDELKTTISVEKLEEGLHSPSTPVQLLCTAYLRKAADTPSGASFVSCSASLVKTLITVWLASESTEVAERALEVITALLIVDHVDNVTTAMSTTSLGPAQYAEGQGLFWRRIFHDPAIYALLFQWTSLVKSNHDLHTKKGKQAATISQARLLDLIAAAAALDLAAVTTSTHPDIEREYSRPTSVTEQPYGGLLKYAANGMIDTDDILMELLRREFFVKLLHVVQDAAPRGSTPRMLAAIEQESGVQREPDGDGDGDGIHL